MPRVRTSPPGFHEPDDDLADGTPRGRFCACRTLGPEPNLPLGTTSVLRSSVCLLEKVAVAHSCDGCFSSVPGDQRRRSGMIYTDRSPNSGAFRRSHLSDLGEGRRRSARYSASCAPFPATSQRTDARTLAPITASPTGCWSQSGRVGRTPARSVERGPATTPRDMDCAAMQHQCPRAARRGGS